MNKVPLKSLLYLSIVVYLLLLAGCGNSPTKTPAITPTLRNSDTPTLDATSTPTHTLAPTATPTSTVTPTATAKPTKTITPTPDCQVSNGEWQSKETSGGLVINGPLLTFTVRNCKITSWEIWSYPLPGELFFHESERPVAISANQFVLEIRFYGSAFSLSGTFDTDNNRQRKARISQGIFRFWRSLAQGCFTPLDCSASRLVWSNLVVQSWLVEKLVDKTGGA